MKRAVFFVEGKADAKFLQDFVEFHFKVKLKPGSNLIACGGCGELTKQAFEEYALKDLTNVIIFDADDEKQKTNFATTRARIDAELAKSTERISKAYPQLEMQFDVFLFPNNQDNGDLETLLERIINPDNKPILDCWDGYERCLKEISTKDPKLTLPIRKSKMYSYTKLLLPKPKKGEIDQAKEEFRDYTNERHWTLTSSATERLKIFLEPYFPKDNKI